MNYHNMNKKKLNTFCHKIKMSPKKLHNKYFSATRLINKLKEYNERTR